MSISLISLLGLEVILSSVLTAFLSSQSSRLELLDHPNERSLHTTPIPRTGGISILGTLVFVFVASLLLEWSGAIVWYRTSVIHTKEIIWLLCLTIVLGILSLWDDRADISPTLKLGAHALAAAAFVWGTGLVIDTVPFPMLGSINLAWLAAPVTVLFIVWMTNLYNFMDGMDGFAGGMTVLGYAVLGYLAWRGGDQFVMVLSFVVGAAAAGFLVYNLPPARIFMGDVGSVSLGFLTAALVVKGLSDGLFDIWVPLLIFSPFIVDATVTLIWRLMRSQRVWRAHREHFYQRLVLAGWGHRKTVLVEYALMALCGITALVYVNVSDASRLVLLLLWMVAYIVLAWNVLRIEKRAQIVSVAG